MAPASKAVFTGVLLVACFGLGVFGGFAGGYLIGLPLTVLVPVLPVRLARFRGMGSAALVAYAFGVLLAVAWLMGNSLFLDSPPHWPQKGLIVVCGILVVLVALMLYAAFRKPYVRNPLP